MSKRNCDKLIQLDISNEKVSIIPNGYNSNLFKEISTVKAKEKLNIPKNKKIILSVGNLKPVKGHEYLIKAMNILIKKEKNVFCFIIGSGIQKKNLNNLISI